MFSEVLNGRFALDDFGCRVMRFAVVASAEIQYWSGAEHD
jgi:hypothetical protein